ncbi:MAG: RluA family pseudouridine synthase [Rubellimicrobium sp.]|nr:RluA family pseudouridine synthase [Rubellimicrobium sp.]
MSGVRILTVEAGEGEQRLDRWLRRRFPHLTQGAIEKMCRKGELRVDGGRAQASTRIGDGQKVRLPPLGEAAAMPAPAPQRATPLARDAQMMRDAVIWMDDHIIAINKPAGLPSQGGSGQGERHVDGLSAALMFDRDEKPRLVHRLDKDTSGVLLLARSARVARGLSEALRHRNVKKIYWAAVAGVPDPKAGAIRYGLLKVPSGRHDEKMRCIHPAEVDSTPGAQRALTHYVTMAWLAGRASWVGLSPITGRTHQLRAHLAELGNPILGDTKYGGSAQENAGDGWGAGVGGGIARQLHLHARAVVFEHPVTKKVISVVAPLPPHMRETWEYVGWDADYAVVDPFTLDRDEGRG